MPSPVTWECSATYLSSFVGAARALGHLERVLGSLDDATRSVVEAPHTQSWWPGVHLLALMDALEKVGGPGTVREAGIKGSRERMGPLVRPLAGVLLALTRSPLEALLSRLGTFVSAGVRGVEAQFVVTAGQNAGAVTFTFPEPVPAVMAEAWYGLFDVGFTLAKAGQLVGAQVEPRVHRFSVRW